MSAPLVDAQSKVQETADDAAISKLSAVRMGYINDPFIKIFVGRFQRRSPLINRGYFARMAAVDLILRRFVAISKRTGPCQVVSLGAGMDTAFFRAYLDGNAATPTTYFEVDFPDITTKKAELIKQHPVLQKCIAGVPVSDADLHGSPPAAHPTTHPSPTGPSPGEYHGLQLFPVGGGRGGVDVHGPLFRMVTSDLRDIASLQAALASAGFDPTVPTLFLSECVLVYLEPEDSCSIIAWAARSCPRSVFVTYEQIRPHDAFGQVMARNLEERGYALRGLHAFPDIPAQTARYRELGYAGCTVIDMNDVYYRLLPRAEVARIERLEMFDELEEWHLMSAHYALAIAVNDADLGTGMGGALGSSGVHARGGAAMLEPPSPGLSLSSSLGPRTPAPALLSTPGRGSGSGVDAVDADVAMASGRSTPSVGSVATPASKVARTSSVQPVASPRELAVAVVASHEETERAHGHGHGHGLGGSGVYSSSLGGTRHSGRAPSPSPSVMSVSSHSGLVTGLSGSRGRGQSDVRRDVERSASIAGMESEGEGGGATYASRDHGLVASATRAGLVAPSPRPMSVAGSDGGFGSTGGGGYRGVGGGGSGTPMSMTGPSGGGMGSTPVLHTEAGDIVLGTAGPLDFDAIAAADDELAHARHIREAFGIDILRDTGEDVEDTASVVSSSASMSMSGGAGHPVLSSHGEWGSSADGEGSGPVETVPRSRGEGTLSAMPPPPTYGTSSASSSVGGGDGSGAGKRPRQQGYTKSQVAAMLMAPVKDDGGVGGGKEGGAGTGGSTTPGGAPHLYRPAVEASRAHSLQAVSSMGPRPAYDVESVRAAAAARREMSLYEMLFPVDAWSGGGQGVTGNGRISLGGSGHPPLQYTALSSGAFATLSASGGGDSASMGSRTPA